MKGVVKLYTIWQILIYFIEKTALTTTPPNKLRLTLRYVIEKSDKETREYYLSFKKYLNYISLLMNFTPYGIKKMLKHYIMVKIVQK